VFGGKALDPVDCGRVVADEGDVSVLKGWTDCLHDKPKKEEACHFKVRIR
jgi:hypothetical protein